MTGAALGLVSGILWLKIGYVLHNFGIGDPFSLFSLFVAPAILPLPIAGAYIGTNYSRGNLGPSIAFVAVCYVFHLLLMFAWFVYAGISTGFFVM